jgi:hypothetical protein
MHETIKFYVTVRLALKTPNVLINFILKNQICLSKKLKLFFERNSRSMLFYILKQDILKFLSLEEEILFLLLFKKTKTRLIPIFELIKRYDLLQTSLINHFQMQLLKF